MHTPDAPASPAAPLDLIRRRYEEARTKLAALVQPMPEMPDKPVLLTFHSERFSKALWAEVSFLESLLFADIDPDVARNTHDLFFLAQRADGLIPAVVADGQGRDLQHRTRIFGQLQQNVPGARTAWLLAQKLRDETFLARAYAHCRRFHEWIERHRHTRGSVLVEMFCEFDMGLDNSPRACGFTSRGCPGDDAVNPDRRNGWPILAPDLSAVIYGGLSALSAMADALGRPAEARDWRGKADRLREAILTQCYDSRDDFYYDIDTDGKFRRYRETQLLVLAQEHVLEQSDFDRLWTRYLHNPAHYWRRYPFTSYSASEPGYEPKANAWSGATLLNIPIRTLLWMPHYLKPEQHREYMRLWVDGIATWDHWASIVHPDTGRPFTGDHFPDMNSVMLTYIEFVQRLGLHR